MNACVKEDVRARFVDASFCSDWPSWFTCCVQFPFRTLASRVSRLASRPPTRFQVLGPGTSFYTFPFSFSPSLYRPPFPVRSSSILKFTRTFLLRETLSPPSLVSPQTLLASRTPHFALHTTDRIGDVRNLNFTGDLGARATPECYQII